MVSYHVSVSVYTPTMTEDEFASLLGAEFMEDVDGWDVEWGESSDIRGDERYLYWQGNLGAWWDEVGESHVVDLLELRADITRIKIRVENHDANYDEVIQARELTRDGDTSFNPVLMPETYPAMIAAIRDQRAAGNEAGAWLSVGHLLAAIEKGASL